ncbi:molybdenum cofactor biosysynthesis protein [Coraliomargarita sp. SDUM461003]|uniref:Molybdenum cofactor biosysynthesis protein n=1 Tax=Thalassobacterium maritimum TaxID=3041265 RepID=A0ABU1AVF2_9BACT|nr:MOSC domain-containing protein [Coraliomargarita sp. SDUM461003]MBT61986.1 molybdenum cofactor biosysynthesis protein [Puniceicoccaceae bacterium]MDQ8208125.1 molybdenum cofactor biosysynthesis protein [Coraliomargarita sp. SDUM461003]|tara:strand:+ start:200 stop:676 length:477 start_codon:yes stop_codon:yes gene_type:complete
MQIHAIYISTGHDFVGRHGKGRLQHGIEKVESVECVAGAGLRGDRYFQHKEDYKGQITFFDWAVYQRIRRDFDCPALDPAWFRRNVLCSGVDLNTLIGQRFSLQGIEFEGSEECRPCYWMDEAVAPGVHEALKGFGGLRARILSHGTLHCDGAEPHAC